MQITIRDMEQRSAPLILSYNKEFFVERTLQERSTQLSDSLGKVSLEETWFQDVLIFSVHNHSPKSIVLQLKADGRCGLMSFCLQGTATFAKQGKPEAVLSAGYYNFKTCAKLKSELTIIDHSSFTCLVIRKRMLARLGPLQCNPFGATPICQQECLRAAAPCPSRMVLLLHEIANAEQPSHVKQLFLEAKVLELMAVDMEYTDAAIAAGSQLNESDIEKLNEAKRLVEADICTPCSLIELSRRTGLNDFKLKKGFKELFGNTVFGYLTEYRMAAGYQHLLQGATVSEVADQVGYKNPQHFTAAFKKKYGILPSSLKH